MIDLVEPTEDEHAFLTAFWRRSIDKNLATGKPSPFQVISDTQRFDTSPFPDRVLSKAAPSAQSRAIVSGLPQIDSFDPYWDDQAGAGYTIPFGNPNIVTITGSNFLPTASVQFDGIDATNVVVQSSTKITCQTPPDMVGPTRYKLVEVAVSNATPFDAALSDSLGTFQYERVPAMMSLNGLTSIDNNIAVGIGFYPAGVRQTWPLQAFYDTNTAHTFPWIGWMHIQSYPVGSPPSSGASNYSFVLNGFVNLIIIPSGSSGQQFIVSMTTFETNPATFSWVYGIS